MEGVHVDLGLVGLDDVGWKAVAVNVSDVAAMGGEPLHLLVTVAAPPGTDLDALASGIGEAADEWSCAVVGGDLTNAPVLVVTVAVTGQVDGPPVLRSGAHPGDVVYVTGPLGAGAAALRSLRAGGPGDAYRRPRARVAEGAAARRAGATSMIDVSDGLAADLGHIADESGVGVTLDDVPTAPGATEADALGGGEDFELVFTLATGVAPPPGSLRLGVCTADPTSRTLRGEPLGGAGWQHRFP